MSRDPYSTREMVEDDLNEITDALERTGADAGRLIVAVLIVLTRAVADVADAMRSKP